MKASLIILISLRFLMVVLPQIGYIHPDEFFQSVEITAGDILNIDVYRPWEFESTSPLRSISFPYIMSGLPIVLLKWLQDNTLFTITPYWLLVLPRLWMALLSLITDYSIYTMCKTFDIDSSFAMKIYASSYVALVYMTRTFSNSLETILVSLFIVILLKSSAIWKVKRLRKSSKLCLELEAMTPVVSFLIGITVTAGIFNRPTYIVFILAPTLLWLFLFIKKSSVPDISISLMNMTLYVSIGILFSFIIFICIDTSYFNPKSADYVGKQFHSCVKKDILESYQCFKNNFSSIFIATPWNFISYNTQNDNLAQHGLHPRVLHILVNVPLLLGPLVIWIYLTLFRIGIQAIKLTSVTNFKILYLSILFLCPILCLSIYPHQESRFLLPVVPAACVLAAEILQTRQGKKLFWTSLISFNVISTLFFGFLHQGGVIPSIMEIQSDWRSNSLKGDNSSIDTYVVFYKTYMPPRHLFISNHIKVIDLGSASVHQVTDTLTNLKRTTKTEALIKLIAPSTVFHELEKSIPGSLNMEFICPHISTEDPPDIFRMLQTFNNLNQNLSDFCMHIMTILKKK